MLSLAKARKDYYLQKLGEISPREDYYLQGGTATGHWHGQGAATEDIEGTVSTQGLVRLFDGQHPATGEQLGRTVRKDAVAAWDLTFSADKSVSVLWALGDTDTRRHVAESFEEATKEAVAYLESVASSTRGARRVAIRDDNGNHLVDETGKPRYGTETWPIETTGYLAAWFTEYTSRADDPQLHTHVVVGNRVKGEDGKWRTLNGRLLYRHQLAAGYIHEAELRARLTQRLGVRWQPVEMGMADIQGFTREQIQAFSQRRQLINQTREDLGVEDTAANNEAITLATRGAKTGRPLADLMPEWQQRAEEAGLTPERIAPILHRSRQLTQPNPEGLFADLVSETGLTAEDATFGQPEVITAVAGALPEGGNRQQIEKLAGDFVREPDVVPLLHAQPIAEAHDTDPAAPAEPGRTAESAFERRYTTTEMLATEQRVVDRAVNGIGAGRWTSPDLIVDKTLSKHPTLTDGQRQLVRQLATSGNTVDIGVGPAGSGKSTALSVIRDLAEQTNTPILGCALAARAAAGFEHSTGIPSTTLTRLLGGAETTGGLPDRSIVVVDEASMVGSRHLARLTDQIESAGGKMVLLGDDHQLPEIQAGGLFHTLTSHLPAVRLTENVRQVEAWEQQALQELRTGSVSRAVAMYKTRGRIQTAPTADDTIQRAVDAWHDDIQQLREPADALLIAHRNQTVEALNQAARSRMAETGQIYGPTITVGTRALQAGDRVVCRKNASRLAVNNGDLATITAVDPKSNTVSIQLDHNGETRHLPAWYVDSEYLDYGYAITCHKAQGATAATSHVVVTEGVDREWVYVAMSRGRDSNVIHLVEAGPQETCLHLPRDGSSALDGLVASLGRTGAKRSASELKGIAPHDHEASLATRI